MIKGKNVEVILQIPSPAGKMKPEYIKNG